MYLCLSASKGLVIFRCVSPQPGNHHPAGLQTPAAPVSPSRATEVSGNRQGRTWGSKGVHTRHRLPSDRLSGTVWVLHSQTGSPSTRQMLPTPIPIPLLPLDLDSLSPWPFQTVWGQRVTQQPHIRHGSSPLCPYECWMVNHPKISLLECGFEFLQRWTQRPQGDR